MKNLKVLCAVIAILLFSQVNSNAAGFSTGLHSVSALANSNSGEVTGSHNISDSFTNPAVLANVKAQQAVLGLSHLNSDVDDDNATAINGSLFGSGAVSGVRNNDGGDDKAFLPIFYYAKRLNDSAVFGLNITTPFALSSKYDENWVGRYHAIESRAESVNINPAISYEINDKLAVGAGLQAQYFKTILTKAVFDGSSDSRGKLKADDLGFGYNFGAKYKINEKTLFGFGYRSKIVHKLEGKSQVPSLNMFSDITAKITTPESLTIGVSHALGDKTELLADISWMRWSRVKNFDVVAPQNTSLNADDLFLNFRDTFKYSLGVNYKLNEKLKLKSGTAYEQGANSSPNTTSPRIPTGDLIWASLGFEYKLKNDLKLNASYLHQFYKKTHSTIQATSQTSSLNSDYKIAVNVFAIGVVWGF